MSRLKIWAAAALSALYPPDAVCIYCGREATLNEAYACINCAPHVKPPGAIAPPPGLSGVSAGFLYNAVTGRCIHSFKYGEAQYLMHPLAAMMRLPEHLSRAYISALVPMPLSQKRLRERGFNQSELLARAFSKKENIPVDTGMLLRVKETIPQASLHREQRRENVQDAFLAKGAQGKTLLLVDDIITTGFTLSAAAQALLAAGACAVYAACVAAASPTELY